ncbi:MAG TPA: glycosyltransferase [Chitinophagales bacterium]|nr:glycosyltransferase [Chitinophagales bacterium]
MQTYFDKHLFKPIRLHEQPDDRLSLIIVIPCFNEPDIVGTLNSLRACEPCSGCAEIIIVINSSADASPAIKSQNEKTFHQIVSWKENVKNLPFKIFILRDEDLPSKHAGVGLARKIGMDEAAFRFERIGRKGILLCLDADCTVEPEYLRAVESYFWKHRTAKAASIYFEHPLDALDSSVREGIMNYELHLRYYVQALRYAGYPYSFHTIGSCMCVRSDVYQRAGGMNRRKAGEDFYFLHKIMPMGGFGEITTTTVYPSSRISERVPFGTGKAMNDWVNKKTAQRATYDVRIFDDLKIFLSHLPALYGAGQKKISSVVNHLPEAVRTYLLQNDFSGKMDEISRNTASAAAFIHRTYRWLDGFRILKMVHFMRDNFFPNIPVSEAAKKLLKRINRMACDDNSLLDVYRKLDKPQSRYSKF